MLPQARVKSTSTIWIVEYFVLQVGAGSFFPLALLIDDIL
jgi:hypothetical protein